MNRYLLIAFLATLFAIVLLFVAALYAVVTAARPPVSDGYNAPPKPAAPCVYLLLQPPTPAIEGLSAVHSATFFVGSEKADVS